MKQVLEGSDHTGEDRNFEKDASQALCGVYLSMQLLLAGCRSKV